MAEYIPYIQQGVLYILVVYNFLTEWKVLLKVSPCGNVSKYGDSDTFAFIFS